MTSGPVPAYPSPQSSTLALPPRWALALMACAASLLCLASPAPAKARKPAKPAAVEKPASAENPAACTTPTQDMIAHQFDRLNRALATGNADAVARLYAEDAVLRVSPDTAPLMGRAAIKAYFAGFLAGHPQGTLSKRSINVSCNAASDTGNYVYRLTGKRKGTRTLLTGRYSTFYGYRDGDWLIIRHQG